MKTLTVRSIVQAILLDQILTASDLYKLKTDPFDLDISLTWLLHEAYALEDKESSKQKSLSRYFT